MKTLRRFGPWAFKAYIIYSVCLDVAVVGTAVWWFFVR